MPLDLKKQTYFVITGASRGIGQTMAIRVAEKLADHSVIVLMARNQAGLDVTKSQIAALGKEIQVLTYAIDLSTAKATQFREVLENSLKTFSENSTTKLNFERAFIIHNAGTVGDVSKLSSEVSDTDAWTAYYHMNLFHVIALNVEFFQKFKDVEKIIVNVSSKCAVEPFVSMSFYCSGKAARDMYFRTLAAEEADTIVLNYAPGPINTDMSLELQRNSVNTELIKTFKELRESNKMLTTTQTTEKFLKVLEEHNFKNGDHVDYFD